MTAYSKTMREALMEMLEEELSPEQIAAEEQKAMDQFNSDMAKEFPAAKFTARASTAPLGGGIVFVFAVIPTKAAKGVELLNAPAHSKYMMHLTDNSGKRVPMSKFSIASIMGKTPVKFRKITGKSPTDAVKKMVDWFKKNKSDFEGLVGTRSPWPFKDEVESSPALQKAAAGALGYWKGEDDEAGDPDDQYDDEEERQQNEGKEKEARQLVNPNKEVMVVKKNKVIVINKKDEDKYLKQGWSLAEEVELDEANFEIKNGKIHISKKDYAKKPKEYKGKRNGKPTLMALDPKTGSTTSFEVVLEEADLDEAKFQVKSAASKKGKISVTSFDNLKDAEKHLAGMEKKGHKGIISKDGKPVFRGTPAEIKKQMKSHKKKHDKIGIGEGTWGAASTPKEKNQLKKYLSKPFKAKDFEKLYDLIGDDGAFDDFGEYAKKNPNADLRPMMKDWMYELGIFIKEETILDRIDRKLKERKNG